MYRGSRDRNVAQRSQARVQNLVDVCAKGSGIDRRKPTPPGEQALSRKRLTRHWTQFRDRLAGARDGDRLAARRTVDHIAAMVAKVSDADVGHGQPVYHV